MTDTRVSLVHPGRHTGEGMTDAQGRSQTPQWVPAHRRDEGDAADREAERYYGRDMEYWG